MFYEPPEESRVEYGSRHNSIREAEDVDELHQIGDESDESKWTYSSRRDSLEYKDVSGLDSIVSREIDAKWERLRLLREAAVSRGGYAEEDDSHKDEGLDINFELLTIEKQKNEKTHRLHILNRDSGPVTPDYCMKQGAVRLLFRSALVLPESERFVEIFSTFSNSSSGMEFGIVKASIFKGSSKTTEGKTISFIKTEVYGIEQLLGLVQFEDTKFDDLIPFIKSVVKVRTGSCSLSREFGDEVDSEQREIDKADYEFAVLTSYEGKELRILVNSGRDVFRSVSVQYKIKFNNLEGLRERLGLDEGEELFGEGGENGLVSESYDSAQSYNFSDAASKKFFGLEETWESVPKLIIKISGRI